MGFVDPIVGSSTEAKRRAVLVYTGVFMGLSISTVATRLYVRIRMVKMIGLDDLFILGALTCTIAFSACTILTVRYGLGYHVHELPAGEVRSFMKSFYGLVITYFCDLGLFKISILLQYLRLFDQSLRRVCYVLMFVVVGHTVSSMLVAAFFCSPIAYFWDPRIPNGHCLNRTIVWFFINCIHMVTDVIIFILPLHVVRKLQMQPRQKIGLMFIFAVGLFVVLVSILRMPSVWLNSKTVDQTYDNLPSAVWTIIEGNIAVTVACLPALKPLFNRFFPSLLGSAGSRNRNKQKRGFQQPLYDDYTGSSSKRSRNTITSSRAFWNFSVLRTGIGSEEGKSATDLECLNIGSEGGAEEQSDGVRVTTRIEKIVEPKPTQVAGVDKDLGAPAWRV